MAMRASTLANNPLAITRELEGKYELLLEIKSKFPEIEAVANMDIDAILAALEAGQDFTGITVVTGPETSWDPINKILVVATVQGEQGIQGIPGPVGSTGQRGERGPIGLTGLNGTNGINGTNGRDGINGVNGIDGVDGQDLTIEQINYNGNGTFTWQFSDGTNYVTPDLKGSKGDTGLPGIKGDTGISVHHIKGTSTTNPIGDFGTSPFIDTYTVYGDANETINLGHFVVANGVSDGMSMSIYDMNANGIVDNSERLGGVLAANVFEDIDSRLAKAGGTISGNLTVSGDLTVNGTAVTVNTQTVEVEDNLILLNNGEVGAGVTAGIAGIEVDRGSEENYKFAFTEADDSFKIGKASNLQKVATREDTPLNTGIAVWNDTASRFDTDRSIDVDSVSFGGNGTVSWNTDETTLDVALGTATLQVGQETLVKVRASAAVTNGRVVMATGSVGNSGRITVGHHDGTKANGKRILGVATQDIANGADGFVTAFGKVRNINTTGSDVGESWVDGDVLYVKPNDGGRLTKVAPLSTELNMPVAFVVHAHTNGTLFVRVTGIDENVGVATKLATARTIGMTGDVSWTSASFDGSGNVSGTATLANSGVTAGTYDNVTVDAKGRVTSATHNDSANISALSI